MRKSLSLTYCQHFIATPIAATVKARCSLHPQGSMMWNAIVASLKSFSTKGTDTAANPLEKPRELPTVGFPTIQTDQLFEEEDLSDYKPDRFYPVELGEILQGRYQTIAKLGFGTSSTTWLARDLRDHQYVALKVCVHTSLVHRELPFYHHITHCIKSNLPERQVNIRRLLDSFQIAGPCGTYIALVFEAAQMSL
ncbi:hypothetical protein BJX99DRAFT_263087 [Aspergillus californicus]